MHTVNGLKKDSSQWHCSTCPLLLFWSPAASCATNIFPLLKPTWVTVTLSVDGVAQMYVYSYGCSSVCFLFIHSGCILHLLLFPYLYRWKNIFWHIGALVCTQLIHYLCHCLCQSKIYTHDVWTCHCRSDSFLMCILWLTLETNKICTVRLLLFLLAHGLSSQRQKRHTIKKIQIFFFLLYLIMCRCTKACKK